MRISPFLWACSVIVACSSLASAADISRPIYKAPAYYSHEPVYSWTGFYAGIHGGYGWSRFKGSDPVAGDSTVNARGWLGGVQLGYNYQVGKFVIGVEGDYSWADVKNVTSDPLGLGGGEATLKNDYFITAAARLGYAFDRSLLYVKGGGAWTRDKIDITDGVGGFGNGTFRRSGWMAGAGIEYAVWNNLSAKIEYNILSFGSIDETLTTGGGLAATTPSVSFQTHLVKVGLNYKFF
jgi:outer membrane immunogenic protein